MMSDANFLINLLLVSEKAARIARICRRDDRLLSLLIEEKTNLKKNTSFVPDFKTLADVLIQEVIRHDLEKEFPSLKGSIYGEENNAFTNALGETVTLVISHEKSQTVAVLTKILNGDVEAALSLSNCVHEDIPVEDLPVLSLPDEIPDLNLDNLALWIDPIDSTAEYINGGVISGSGGVPCSGLTCVTVILGAFNKVTGVPVAGVINQPFYELDGSNSFWKGRCVWGLSQNGYHVNSLLPIEITNRKPLIALSMCEDASIRKKLQDADFELIYPSGAGNKCLNVILGKVDAYVLSQKTTFYWDTCGCHAILKSVSGNVWNYQEAMKGNLIDIFYREKSSSFAVKDYSNKCGLIACRNEQLVQKIIDILQ